MTVAELRALTAPKSTGKGKTPATAERPSSPAQNAKEAASRAAVVGVGRLGWENTTFGLPTYCRKYRLLDPAHAAALDALFWSLTNTTP